MPAFCAISVFRLAVVASFMSRPLLVSRSVSIATWTKVLANKRRTRIERLLNMQYEGLERWSG